MYPFFRAFWLALSVARAILALAQRFAYPSRSFTYGGARFKKAFAVALFMCGLNSVQPAFGQMPILYECEAVNVRTVLEAGVVGETSDSLLSERRQTIFRFVPSSGEFVLQGNNSRSWMMTVVQRDRESPARSPRTFYTAAYFIDNESTINRLLVLNIWRVDARARFILSSGEQITTGICRVMN